MMNKDEFILNMFVKTSTYYCGALFRVTALRKFEIDSSFNKILNNIIVYASGNFLSVCYRINNRD